MRDDIQMGRRLPLWKMWAKEHPEVVKARQVKLMAESNEQNKDWVVFWSRAASELWNELTKEQKEEFEGQTKSHELTLAAIQPK